MVSTHKRTMTNLDKIIELKTASNLFELNNIKPPIKQTWSDLNKKLFKWLVQLEHCSEAENCYHLYKAHSMKCLGHLLVDAILVAFPSPKDQSLIWVPLINKQSSHAGCKTDYAVFGNFGNLVIWLLVEPPRWKISVNQPSADTGEKYII